MRAVDERKEGKRERERERFRVPDGFSKPTPHLRRNYNITRALCAKRNLLQPVYTRKTHVSDVDRRRGYRREKWPGTIILLVWIPSLFVYFDPSVTLNRDFQKF